jgi:hypothetical protein
MSDFITCPVCETANQPDATNCEVCGERLAPLQPGEELNPEENVSAMLAAQAEEAAAAPQPAEEPVPMASGFDVDDEDDYDPIVEGDAPVDTMMEEAPAAPAADEELMGIDPVDEPVSFYGDDAPDVLYSPTTGEAYPKGTAEYEEGFGPMGEQLVATPPAQAAEAEAVQQPEAEEQASFEGGYDDEDDLSLAPSTDPEDEEPSLVGFDGDDTGEEEAPSFDDDDELDAGVVPAGATTDVDPAEVEKANPFRVSGPNPAVVLPKPGTYAEPASVTLYYQKQPVLTHDIETDETLIGRKDIRADIYPDIDLSQYDPESFVSRKHAYIYRQNKNYTLYAISNGGVQLNSDLLELGDKRQLSDGDVIVIAGFLAFKFSKGA